MSMFWDYDEEPLKEQAENPEFAWRQMYAQIMTTKEKEKEMWTQPKYIIATQNMDFLRKSKKKAMKIAKEQAREGKVVRIYKRIKTIQPALEIKDE